MRFGLLVFPNVQQLDLTGPYEVFASWPQARVRLVAKTLEPVLHRLGSSSSPTRRSTIVRSSTSFACPAGQGSTR